MAGEKRSQEQEETLYTQTTVLVDIEGTTTSISFVKETLFPYVRQNLKDYIEAKWEDLEFKQDYEKLKEQAKKDEEDKLDGFVTITGDNVQEEKDSLLRNVLWQMDNDRKTGALKQLQGHMWREAYTTGAVKSHIYEDVPKAFESWTNSGKKIYVYSSGSVEAQKLLFEYSIHGNLLKYFSGFFDTEVGAKQECDSYKNILSKIGEKPANVLFLTDVTKEAVAAKEAGLSTVIVVREGNTVLTDEEKSTFVTIESFSDLIFQMSTKRQKLEVLDEKTDDSAVGSGKSMDTSVEDVEMSDSTEKKFEKNDESVKTECLKNQSPEAVPTQLTKKKESKDSLDEQQIPISEATECSAKSKEISEKLESVESADKILKDNIAINGDTIVTTEKTEEKLDLVANEITSAVSESVDISMSESVPKSETASISSEKNDDQSVNIAKNTDEAQITETDKKIDDENIIDKDCLTVEKDEIKEKSKIISEMSESEEVTKTGTTAMVVTENSETTEPIAAASTVIETEATTSTAESSLETIAVSEKIDEKLPQENTVAAVTNAENQCENKIAKQEEATMEIVNEDNVVDIKDRNTVDLEEQKLNGIAQNGDTDMPVLDDKLHSNVPNGGESSKDETNSTANDDVAAQNGEPETLESSAESIKVKKVVDSNVADSSGDDVVSPVVVAATS